VKVGGWFVLGVSGYLVIGYWLLVAEVQCKSSTGWYILYERMVVGQVPRTTKVY